jgi:hypothetical protein
MEVGGQPYALAALTRAMNPGTYLAPQPASTVCRREKNLTLMGLKARIVQLAISRPWGGLSHKPQYPNYALHFSFLWLCNPAWAMASSDHEVS